MAATSAFGDANSDARNHFERGSSLFDLGKYAEAAVEYEKAYEIKSDPALLFNIGQAYRLANRLPEALTAYRSFLRRSSNPPNRADVEARIVELQKVVEGGKRAVASQPVNVLKPGQALESASTQVSSSSSPPPPPAAEAAPAPPPSPAVAEVVATSPPPKVPLYKKWWLWTAVAGVVVVGVVVGVSVAATTPDNEAAPAGAIKVSF